MTKNLLLFFTFFAFCHISVAQNGKLIGKITDNQGLSMPGATVKLSGDLTKAQVSDQSGKFVFNSLKKGSYTVTVSYIGYETVNQKLDVDAGVKEIRFVLEEKSLEGTEIIVVGDRLKGQAKAINQQRNNSFMETNTGVKLININHDNR